MANKSYVKIDPRKAFSPKKKFEKLYQDAHREAHKQWAIRMADGYNKIVANWSEDVKPKFIARHRYIKKTNRVFAYVYIQGPELAKAVFMMIDYGNARGQTVSAGPGIKRAVEEIQADADEIYFAAVPPKPKQIYNTKGEPLNKTEMNIWKARKKQVEAQNRRARKEVKQSAKRQAKRTGPGRTRKKSRLGIQRYTPRTSAGGGYTGPGQAASGMPKKTKRGFNEKSSPTWRGHGQPKSVVLGPIAARGFSDSLMALIQGRSAGKASAIWGTNMSHDYVVKKGYREGKKREKASGK